MGPILEKKDRFGKTLFSSPALNCKSGIQPEKALKSELKRVRKRPFSMIFSEKILEETLLNPLFRQKYLKFPEYSGNNGPKYAQSGLRTVKDFSD